MWGVSKTTSLKAWLISIAVFVVVVALVVAGAVWWAAHNRYHVEPAQPLPAVEQVMQAPAGPAPDVAAAVDQAAKDPALGELAGYVYDVESGQGVWGREGMRPMVPASSTKVLTAAAAVATLDLDSRAVTRVYAGEPGQLIIQSDGDVTLSADGSGFFTDPASIKDLAAQVSEHLEGPVTSIVVDNSIRAGEVFNPTWDGEDIAGGNVADLDAVMLNAGRLDASESYSPRSTTPGEDVGQALAAALGTSAEVSLVATAPAPAGEPLGVVESAPLDVRLRDMMVHSDNLLAESIARQVAAARGKPATFAGATEATIEVLQEQGLDTTGTVLKDNSGMSKDNRITAALLASVLGTNRALLDLLPVSHAEGTLAARFGEGSGADAAAGWVRAKTGTLSGVSALVGTVMTEDGRALTFAFLSNGSEVGEARAALDRLAASLRKA